METEKSFLEEGSTVIEVIRLHGAPPQSDDKQVLAIGKFDGVHLGHQSILRQVKNIAGDAKVSVMSFWPHPAWALGGKAGYDRSLTPETEQARLLNFSGVNRLYRVRFSPEYAKTTAEEFVGNHLSRLNLSGVVVGFDFSFGQGGKATAEDLRQLCAKIDVPVYVVGAVEENGLKVSSSQIRAHLEKGRVEAAEVLLGRPYTVEGLVEHGKKLGRTIGFPTANLTNVDEYVMPAQGVYAVTVQMARDSSKTWYGVLNAGTRPTVDGTKFQMEVHLFNYTGDLYEESLRVSFIRRVRDEKRFNGIEELKAQIGRDVESVREMFGLN